MTAPLVAAPAEWSCSTCCGLGYLETAARTIACPDCREYSDDTAAVEARRSDPELACPTVDLHIVALYKLRNVAQRQAARERAQAEYRSLRENFERAMARWDEQDRRDLEIVQEHARARAEQEGNKLEYLLPNGLVAIGQWRKSPDRTEIDEDALKAAVPLDHPSGAVYLPPSKPACSKAAAKAWLKTTGELLPGVTVVPGERKCSWKFSRDPELDAPEEPKEIP